MRTMRNKNVKQFQHVFVRALIHFDSRNCLLFVDDNSEPSEISEETSSDQTSKTKQANTNDVGNTTRSNDNDKNDAKCLTMFDPPKSGK